MSDIMAAAQTLAVKLGPAAHHSVYVHTSVDDETKEFVRTLHVAVRPGYERKVSVPANHEGHAVKQVPWGDE